MYDLIFSSHLGAKEKKKFARTFRVYIFWLRVFYIVLALGFLEVLFAPLDLL